VMALPRIGVAEPMRKYFGLDFSFSPASGLFSV